MENRIMHEQLTIYSGAPIIARKYDYEKFTFPWHVHNEFEIIYVEEGSGKRFVADNMEEFQAHDLTLIGSGIPHYMKSTPEYEKGDNKLRVRGTIIQFEEAFMAHAINNYADLSHIKIYWKTQSVEFTSLIHKIRRLSEVLYNCPNLTESYELSTYYTYWTKWQNFQTNALWEVCNSAKPYHRRWTRA